MKNISQTHDNFHLMGFDSMGDFLNTTLGTKTVKANAVTGIAAGITGFVTNYVYDDAHAIWFLVFLCTVDLLTGVAKAFRNSNFSSKKFPRAFVSMLAYVCLIAISWNAAKHIPELNFVPGLVYGGVISTLVISVYENLKSLEWIDPKFLDRIFGKFRPEEDKDNKPNTETQAPTD